MSIIGIIGEKGHGKDTAGDYLIREYNFEPYSFAGPMKRAAIELFDFSEEQVSDQKLKETIDERWGITPRRALEALGTEIFQYDIRKHIPELEFVGRKFWVYRFQMWYQQQNNPKAIIKDVRFPHEHVDLKNMNAITFKIYNPRIQNNAQHASETEQANIHDYDELIINDGTIEQLYQKLDDFMKMYFP